MSSEIIQDGSVAGQIPDIPAFRPVQPDVFAERGERLKALAPGHALEPYLRFAAALSAVQAEVLESLPALPLSDERTLAHCRDHGLPVLSVDGHRRDPAWRAALAELAARLDSGAITAQAAEVVKGLRRADEGKLEAAAADLLAGAYTELDPGEVPFIAAALQVYWVKMALQLGERATVNPAQVGLCPVCGSHPVASVVRIGGAQQGLRYLVCSLCASEWHMVRVKCSACGSTKGLSYFNIEAGSEAIKAECCDECKTYLKIFYLEKDTGMIPAADDLASLTLDMLVDDEGYNRIGPNLLFLPGHADT
ncbi:MAG TPA: formate dehydrogenase accessory protein FdhE [Burkholderiales bacterium]|nr:formate dehydrogenase accessory protein FdhE [Burkholderiales bacterium]